MIVFAENRVVYDGHKLHIIIIIAIIVFVSFSSDYDSIHLEDIKHVCNFELILERNVFICHSQALISYPIATMCMFL